MDLCFKHNTEFNTNLVGSRTQINVSYASALLVPCWQLMTFVYMPGRLPWIMLFIVRQLTILNGGLDSFSFGCLNVGVYLSSSWGFSHICSMFRAHLCWGGEVV